MNIKNITVNSS